MTVLTINLKYQQKKLTNKVIKAKLCTLLVKFIQGNTYVMEMETERNIMKRWRKHDNPIYDSESA